MMRLVILFICSCVIAVVALVFIVKFYRAKKVIQELSVHVSVFSFLLSDPEVYALIESKRKEMEEIEKRR